MPAGSLKRQLISSTVILAFLSVLDTAIGLPVSIILARGLDAQGYGVYVYATTVIGLLVGLNRLGVPSVLTRSTARCVVSGEWANLRSMALRFSQILGALSVVIMLLSALALWQLAAPLYLSTHKVNTVLWLLPLLPLSVVGGIIGALLYGMNHVLVGRVVGVIGALLRLMSLGLLFWLAPWARIPEYAAAINVGANLTGCLLLGWWLWRHLPPAFFQGKTAYHTRRWLREATPFILLSGIGLFNLQVDILMLGLFVTAEEVADYQIAIRISGMLLMGPSIIYAVILPQITTMYQRAEYARLQRLLAVCVRAGFACAAVAAAVALLFGEDIIVLLLGRQYAGAYHEMVILSVAMLARATMGPIFLLAQFTHHEKDTLQTQALSVALNISLNLALIPQYGITGAAVATAISWLFQSAYLTRRLSRANLEVGCHLFRAARRGDDERETTRRSL